MFLFLFLVVVVVFCLFSDKSNTLSELVYKWIITGICLHEKIAPLLRKVVERECIKLYDQLKLEKQVYPNFLEVYPDGDQSGHKLSYGNINNNNYFRLKREYFDYCVKNVLDFSKLFLLKHLTYYNSFERCDLSALLTITINCKAFSSEIQQSAEKVCDSYFFFFSNFICVKKQTKIKNCLSINFNFQIQLIRV